MPAFKYQNTYQPNTQIGQGLSNLTQAFFNAKNFDLEQANDQARQAAYNANAEQSQASARKSIAEALGIENQNNQIKTLPASIQAGGGNSEQIAKALQQLSESAKYDELLKGVKTVGDFGAIQAANGGKALFDNATNNAVLNLFSGDMTNEANDLNQSHVKYGSAGTEVGKSQLLVDKSAITENYAQAGNANASAVKTADETARGKNVLSFTGLNADGTENYQYVPVANGGTVKKAGKAADKNYKVDGKDAGDIKKIANAMFGVKLDANGNPTADSEKPLDDATYNAIIGESSKEFQQTNNLPLAVQNTVARLTGGQPLQPSVVNKVGGRNMFGVKQDDQLGVASEKTRGLPKKAQPVKAAPPVSTKGKPVTKQEYDALPVGATYLHPNGTTKIKGGA